MLVKDTEATTHQNAWFAVEDINRRAAAAYKAHVDLFTDATHIARVEAVKRIMREYFAGWAAIYETARAKTSRRDANTEVKFNRIVLNRKNKRNDFLAALAAIGIGADDIVFKPASESYSVHVK